jgi:hypothetical protein
VGADNHNRSTPSRLNLQSKEFRREPGVWGVSASPRCFRGARKRFKNEMVFAADYDTLPAMLGATEDLRTILMRGNVGEAPPPEMLQPLNLRFSLNLRK